MRKLLPFLAFTFCLFVTPSLPAQVPDPGAIQDQEADREKQLKASDDLANIQANSEATKTSVDAMKADVAALQANVTQLQTENAALKQQIADMQTAFDQYKAEQLQARQTLIDNVAAMIANASKNSGAKTRKKKDMTETTADSSPTTGDPAPKPIPSNLVPPPDTTSPSPDTTAPTATTDASPAPPKPKKGYYHVVASGETLTMICEAYRESGVNVTVSEVRKANGLTADSTLKTGQKLFIPKPDPNL